MRNLCGFPALSLRFGEVLPPPFDTRRTGLENPALPPSGVFFVFGCELFGGATALCRVVHINGRREQLEGKIQERYGIAKDQVRRDVDDWLKSMP
jgi:hypothetical protein